MDFTDKKAVNGFLKENGIENLTQLKMAFSGMAGSLLDELLDGERDERLGYSKHDYANKLKLLYLATQEVLKKWTIRTRDWSKILAQLSIHFEDRLTKYL